MKRAGQGREGAEEAGGVLGAEHADDEVERARGQAGQRLGQRDAGGGVVAAVEPELGRAGGLDEGAAAEALQAGGPFGAR